MKKIILAAAIILGLHSALAYASIQSLANDKLTEALSQQSWITLEDGEVFKIIGRPVAHVTGEGRVHVTINFDAELTQKPNVNFH